LGFVVPLGDNRFEILSPTIMRAGVQAIQLGVPLDQLFDVLAKVNRHTRAIADVFTGMVDDGIVRPVEKEGFPAERWPDVLTAIEALRPLAAEVMLAAFKVNMDDAAEDAFGKILTRVAKEGSRGDSAKSAKSSRGRRH
ncbi:MAG TPA: hypothetical protein VGO97_05280, partial [Solirubrobacterales bacterium]|nr:hypothetical protein [Solirubrobacterales bacterium]